MLGDSRHRMGLSAWIDGQQWKSRAASDQGSGMDSTLERLSGAAAALPGHTEIGSLGVPGQRSAMGT